MYEWCCIYDGYVWMHECVNEWMHDLYDLYESILQVRLIRLDKK